MSGGCASLDSSHKELGVVLHGFYRGIRNWIVSCAYPRRISRLRRRRDIQVTQRVVSEIAPGARLLRRHYIFNHTWIRDQFETKGNAMRRCRHSEITMAIPDVTLLCCGICRSSIQTRAQFVKFP